MTRYDWNMGSKMLASKGWNFRSYFQSENGNKYSRWDRYGSHYPAEPFLGTVCKTVRPMLSVRCLSCPVCLSVTFVHCGQTVGRIKMKFGVQVGLGSDHIVLDGDPAPPPLKGHTPPIFSPYLLRPNGCMDQDVSWYGGMPRPR